MSIDDLITYTYRFTGTEIPVQQHQATQPPTLQGQQNPQMAGGQPQQLQGHPTSVQFRHPFPHANLRPGMRVGLAGGPIQVGQTIIQMAFICVMENICV